MLLINMCILDLKNAWYKYYSPHVEINHCQQNMILGKNPDIEAIQFQDLILV